MYGHLKGPCLLSRQCAIRDPMIEISVSGHVSTVLQQFGAGAVSSSVHWRDCLLIPRKRTGDRKSPAPAQVGAASIICYISL